LRIGTNPKEHGEAAALGVSMLADVDLVQGDNADANQHQLFEAFLL
jgi:hypothetical protein